MTKNSTATTMLSVRLTAEERRLIEEAAEKKGWKAAHFLRVSALERAAQVLNLSSPRSFDFSGAAKRFAEVLLAPRTVTVLGDDISVTGDNAENFGTYHQSERVDIDDGPLRPDQYNSTKFVFDLRPAALTHEQVEELQKAMQYGGAEFAAQLIVECRRLASVENDPNLPPPIDPHNINRD